MQGADYLQTSESQHGEI